MLMSVFLPKIIEKMKFGLSEITEIIKDRRTIYPQQFSSRKVHREIIEKLINNGIWAPNHGSTQPWRYRVYQDAGMEQLSEFLQSTYITFVGEGNVDSGKIDKIKMRCERSSAVIALCMKRDARGKIPEIEEIEATACAAQNIQLTATAYGLGCFWSTPKFIYTDLVNDFLQLDEGDKCLGFLYIGYPESDFEWPKGQRKPIEYVTEWIN